MGAKRVQISGGIPVTENAARALQGVWGLAIWKWPKCWFLSGTPDRIRTCDLMLRRQKRGCCGCGCYLIVGHLRHHERPR